LKATVKEDFDLVMCMHRACAWCRWKKELRSTEHHLKACCLGRFWTY